MGFTATAKGIREQTLVSLRFPYEYVGHTNMSRHRNRPHTRPNPLPISSRTPYRVNSDWGISLNINNRRNINRIITINIIRTIHAIINIIQANIIMIRTRNINYMYIHIHIYIYIHRCIYIYICMYINI